HPQVLEVGKFGLDPVESSALELVELGVERQVTWWRARIVKPVHHQEVDTLIAPILRRRKQRAPGSLRLIEHSLNLSVEDRGWHVQYSSRRFIYGWLPTPRGIAA